MLATRLNLAKCAGHALLGASPSWAAQEDDPDSINQQVDKFLAEGKYQKAVPLAEKAVEVARRLHGPEDRARRDLLSRTGRRVPGPIFYSRFGRGESGSGLENSLGTRPARRGYPRMGCMIIWC